MGASGTATLSFGAFPGSVDAAIQVTGQTAIVGGSLVEAWILPTNTADHLAEEHLLEAIDIYAGGIVTGTGFWIYGVYRGIGDGQIYGDWNVGWAWL
jgi:hypothetical protein